MSLTNPGNMINYYSTTEKVVLKTLTFTLTPVLVVMITIVLLCKGRFTDARNWLMTDWREPL